jgi:hypothetical protein
MFVDGVDPRRCRHPTIHRNKAAAAATAPAGTAAAIFDADMLALDIDGLAREDVGNSRVTS